MDITLSELVAALERAQTVPATADGATMMDLMRATGWHYKRISRLLLMLKQEGRLEVRRVYRENLAGYMMPVPAYLLLPEPGTENPPGGSGGFG